MAAAKFRIVSKRTLPLYVVCIFCAVVYTGWFWYDVYHAGPVETYHRAWQAVKDNVYDPDSLVDWNKWEHKFDGEIKTLDDAVRCGKKMVRSLHDRFSTLLDPVSVGKQENAEHGQFKGIGVSFDLLDTKEPLPDENVEEQPAPVRGIDGYPLVATLMPGGPAEKAGIKPGDALFSIGSTSTRTTDMNKLLRILRTGGPTFTLTVLRGGKKMPFTLSPALIPVQVVSSKKLDHNIAYVKLGNFVDLDLVAKMRAAVEQMKDADAMILDLRKNSGGRTDLCLSVASLFLEKGTLVTIKSRIPQDGYNSTTFELAADKVMAASVDTNKKVSSWTVPREPCLWKDKMLVVLVDKTTASSAEMLAAALAENGRAAVFGSKTMGKGIAQTQVMLPNNVRLHITCARYFTPKGNWLGDGGNSQANGLMPDHPVTTAAREINTDEANDKVLQAAIQWLKTQN